VPPTYVRVGEVTWFRDYLLHTVKSQYYTERESVGNVGNNEIHLALDQLRCQTGQMVIPTVGISPIDGDVLPLDVAQLAQSLPKCLERICVGRRI